MGLLQMPSVKNVKKQFCCTRGPYRDPLVHCSLSVSRNYSLTIREQLLWQSLSHTQWMRPCQATTSSTSPNLQTPWRYTTYPTGSHVNLHADGTAKDTDKGSFSYTRVTLPVSLVFTSSASFFCSTRFSSFTSSLLSFAWPIFTSTPLVLTAFQLTWRQSRFYFLFSMDAFSLRLEGTDCSCSQFGQTCCETSLK